MVIVGECYVFFVSSRRRHTRLQGDWSSDVCSSDLGPRAVRGYRHDLSGAQRQHHKNSGNGSEGTELWRRIVKKLLEIGRASCRERVERGGVGGAIRRSKYDRGAEGASEREEIRVHR